MATIDETLQRIRDRLDRLASKARDLPNGYVPPKPTLTTGGGSRARAAARRGGGPQEMVSDEVRRELKDLYRRVRLQSAWVQDVADEMRATREAGEDLQSIRAWHREALANLRDLQARVRELEARAQQQAAAAPDALTEIRVALNDMDDVMHELDDDDASAVQGGAPRRRSRAKASTPAAPTTVLRDGRAYRVHVGPRGGRHIVVRGARVYL